MKKYIVVDANIWIRFARNKKIEILTDRMYFYNFVPVTNNYILSEIFDALVYNNWMTVKQAQAVIHFIETLCVLKTEQAAYRLSPDPKDNYLFDLAIQTNCAFIISDYTEMLAFTLKPVAVYSGNWFLKHFPV